MNLRYYAPVNQRGISLIAVIVAMGIVGILIGIVAQLFDYQIKAQRTLDVRTAAMDMKIEILQMLANRSICEANFQGTNPVTNTPDPSSLVDLSDSPIRLAEDTTYRNSGVRVSSINLVDYQPYASAGPDQFKGTVSLQIVIDSGGMSLGNSEIMRQIELAVVLDGFSAPVGPDPMSIETCVAVGQNFENVWKSKPIGDIYFDGTGNVGVGDNFGENPVGEKLHIDGNIQANEFLYPSDINLKDQIRPIPAVDRLMALEGVEFIWRRTGKPSMGLIAQEVEKIYPYLVKTNAQGRKTVNYIPLIAPLIEANKMLHRQNQSLEERVQKLERKIENLTSLRK